jgi:uncharacterized protein
MRVCPICGRHFEPDPQHKASPFCGSRCKMIDLGNWLGEKYCVAGSGTQDDDPDEDGSSSKPDPSDRGAAHEEKA